MRSASVTTSARAPISAPFDQRSVARCFLCGSSSGVIAWRENGYDARQCACGVLYVCPIPPSDAIDPTDDPHPASFYALPARMKVAWLQRFKRSGRLLEVGCGDGYFLEEARTRGYDVCAIEAHTGRVARIRERLGVDVEHALLENARWPEGSCDIVYHCDLLSHFADPILALKRMRALLRADGVLYFEVGLAGGLRPAWYRFMATIQLPQHRWLYSEAALRSLLGRSGLKVERMKRFGLGPAFVVSRLGRAIGYGGGATTPAAARPRREGVARARVHNFLRYGVGTFAAGVGPQTALVIASRDE